MASSSASKLLSGLVPAAALAVLMAAAAPGAVSAEPSGGSIQVLGRAPGGSPAGDAAPQNRSRAANPQACAADYHARFAAIAEGELAALKSLEPEVGEIDPKLPGRLIFAATLAKPTREEARALEAAADLARLRGRANIPSNANSRWIAGRIEADLTDYLTQGPSPFLCSGVGNYLQTLRGYADQIVSSPAGRLREIEVQRRAATASLHAVHAAMRPAPLPLFAPSDRPGALVSEKSVRREVDMQLRTGGADPIRLAGNRSGKERLSDTNIDPDLPPLSGRPGIPLETRRDLVRAIDDLVRRAEAGGFLAPSSNLAASAGVGRRRNAPVYSSPVLTRLARIEAAVRATHPAPADPLVLPALATAFADLEALDYLMADADGASDPVGAALHATMDAIEAAHAEVCNCRS